MPLAMVILFSQEILMDFGMTFISYIILAFRFSGFCVKHFSTFTCFSCLSRSLCDRNFYVFIICANNKNEKKMFYVGATQWPLGSHARFTYVHMYAHEYINNC